MAIRFERRIKEKLVIFRYAKRERERECERVKKFEEKEKQKCLLTRVLIFF
jgi:hypothetical protein